MRLFGYDIKRHIPAGEKEKETRRLPRPVGIRYYEPSGVPFYDFARSEILDALRMISSVGSLSIPRRVAVSDFVSSSMVKYFIFLSIV